MTSQEANKKIKRLREEKAALVRKEALSSTFRAAIEEKIEDVRPDYSFDDYQDKISKIDVEIAKLRHAINVFNTTTEIVVGNYTFTIDEALAYLPQLMDNKDRLSYMVNRLEKTRIDPVRGSKYIEYDYTNYNLEKARVFYDTLDKLITDIKLALDKANNTIEF